MHGQYDWTGDPASERQGVRVGHRLPGRPVAPLPQLHAPHLHQHRRQGSRHRLRNAAHVRGASSGAPTTSATPSMPRCSRSSSSTASRCTTSRAERIAARRSRDRGEARDARRDLAQGHGQTLKDYVLFPLLSGPSFPFVLAGNATANLTRNLWAFTIIFCGHFPDGTQEFTEEETENETRGEWYYRQLLGSANLTGGELFHILAGNLSFQIEHHLFPDLPAHRYAEIAARSARSPSATASPTTPARCTGSSAASCARSSSSRCPRCPASGAQSPSRASPLCRRRRSRPPPRRAHATRRLRRHVRARRPLPRRAGARRRLPGPPRASRSLRPERMRDTHVTVGASAGTVPAVSA